MCFFPLTEWIFQPRSFPKFFFWQRKREPHTGSLDKKNHVGQVFQSKHLCFNNEKNTEKLPSRELTYPPDKAYLKMIFLFPRWDMLISWSVTALCEGSSIQLSQKAIVNHQISGRPEPIGWPIGGNRGDLVCQAHQQNEWFIGEIVWCSCSCPKPVTMGK